MHTPNDMHTVLTMQGSLEQSGIGVSPPRINSIHGCTHFSRGVTVTMKRFIVVACLTLLFASPTFARGKKTETLDFGTDPGWKVGNARDVKGEYSMIEFIREGDDIQNWKELMTYQNFARPRSFRSPEDSLNMLKKIREENCPGVTEWKVIEQKDDSILYEWHAKPCLNQPEQSEIARILYGKNNVFILHFAAKGQQLPPEKRAEWLKTLSEAKIVGGH